MIVCNLKAILNRKGWSQYRLQKESGITAPTISALYKRSSKLYSARVLSRLCWTLECKLGDLLEYEPERFPRTKRKDGSIHIERRS
jgi:DNA-binding Xre family transcriptional regulator